MPSCVRLPLVSFFLALVLLFGMPLAVLADEAAWETHMKAGMSAYDSGNFNAAATRFEAALREAKAMDEGGLRLAASALVLAKAYQALGRYREAEPLNKLTLKLYEEQLGSENENVVPAINDLATLYLEQGRYLEAEPLFRRGLAILERTIGPDNPHVGILLGNLGNLYLLQGRYSEAEQFHILGSKTVEKILGPSHPSVAAALSGLAQVFLEQGRYSEAESLMRRSLAINEAALGPTHNAVGISLSNLAHLYRLQERFAEAEPLYARSLQIAENAFGADHKETQISLNNLALLYVEQRRYAEAEPLLLRALISTEKTMGSSHPRLASLLGNLEMLYTGQKRYSESEAIIHRILSIREKLLGKDHPDVGTTLNNLAALYKTQGRYADAEPIYRRSLAIIERAHGPNHPRLASSLGNLASLLRQQNRWDDALEIARRATSLLAERYDLRGEANSAAMLSEQRSTAWTFELHVGLLYSTDAGANKVAAEALNVAQLSRASDTADQVARMAARYATGSNALALLARQRQDLVKRLQQIDARIVQAASRAPEDRDMGAEDKLRAQGEDERKALTAVDARMASEFPQYADLTNPRPVAMAATQKLLRADEALVAFLVTKDESFLWVLRQDGVLFKRLSITRSDLVDMVQKLRSQLDPARVLSRAFDYTLAHELYTRMLGPGEKLLVGAKHLIVVPDGALTSLPLGVLLSDKPTGSDRAWLANKYAITVLPSVGSLHALRAFAKRQPASEPFIGFGDPILGGGGEARNIMIGELYSRGAVADTRAVKKLARLPETADELKAIAATLKAPAERVRVGAEATERAVKEMDLSRYRTLAFATHGLMAGEFRGLAEPALVLTPPETGTELDDGLLTASEISQLKLNADWVILSACNTAAPDGKPGAEGLSGLAKAFFYAGARSLLVSHWAVDSEATVALTTRMFVELAKGATKAEALQRSMLAMMQSKDRPYLSHPAFWAPFVVVGEGGVENRH